MGRASAVVSRVPPKLEQQRLDSAGGVVPASTTRAPSPRFDDSQACVLPCALPAPTYASRGVTSKHSSHWPHSDSKPVLRGLLPREPTSCEHNEHVYDADAHNYATVSSVGVHPAPVSAATETAKEPVAESREEKVGGNGIPRCKVLLCGDGDNPYATADLERLKATFLKCIDGLHPDNIRVHSEPRRIGKESDWFFDPDDIAPGGLLILCFTGHGIRTIDGVDLKMDSIGEKVMNTLDLHTALNKIQVPCTIEVVLGTCNSEAVISGLDRLLTMEITKVPEGAQSLSPLSALFKDLALVNSPPKLTTKAKIIVWAAAVDDGSAYVEADLPNRKGKNDIMIGALCRALTSAKGPVPRRVLFGKINKAVTKYNTARDKDYFSKTEAEQYHARVTGRYCGPQLACLLSSPGNSEFILDSPAFVALDEVDITNVHR